MFLLFFPNQSRSDDSNDVGVINWSPVPNAKAYMVEISKTKDFQVPNRIRVEKPKISLDNFKIGTYFFRVASIDEFDKIYEFSKPSKITVDTQAAELLKPEKNSVIDITSAETIVKFEWNKSIGLDEQVLEISTDKEFKKPLISTSIKESFLEKKFDPKQQHLFWRVVSFNSEKTKKLTSEVRELQLNLPKALVQPNLIEPKDKKKFIGSDNSKQKIKFVIDKIAGATKYTFFVSTDLTFPEKSTIRVNTNAPEATAELLPGRYYWKASVSDALGREVTSQNKNIFVIIGRLSTPEFEQNHLNLASRLEQIPFTVQWKPVNGAGVYDLAVATDSSMKKIALKKSVKTTIFTSNLKAGKYFIVVRARGKGVIKSQWSKPYALELTQRIPWRPRFLIKGGYSLQYDQIDIDTPQTQGSINVTSYLGGYINTFYHLFSSLRADLAFEYHRSSANKEILNVDNTFQKNQLLTSTLLFSDIKYFAISQSRIDDFGLFVSGGYFLQQRDRLDIDEGTEVSSQSDSSAEIGPALVGESYKIHGPTLGFGLNYTLGDKSEISLESKYALPISYVAIDGKSAYILYSQFSYSTVFARSYFFDSSLNVVLGNIKFSSHQTNGKESFSSFGIKLGGGYFIQ